MGVVKELNIDDDDDLDGFVVDRLAADETEFVVVDLLTGRTVAKRYIEEMI